MTDNSNVDAWLRKRRAGQPLARQLMRLLQVLESRCGLPEWPLYIRTYHSKRADWLTPEERPTVRAQMKQEGWTEFSVQAEWAHLLEATRRALCPFPPGTHEHHVMQALSDGPAHDGRAVEVQIRLPSLWAPAERCLRTGPSTWGAPGGEEGTDDDEAPALLYEAFAPGTRSALVQKVAARPKKGGALA